MLVLSRKESQRVLFPSLGISLEVMRIQGRKAQIGIDAPPDIPVVREEIASLKGYEVTLDDESANRKLSAVSKIVNDNLHAFAEQLNRLHQRVEDDTTSQKIVLEAFAELQRLQQDLEHELQDDRRHSASRALVIDHDRDERELLSSALRLGGLDVTTSETPADALDFLSLHACPDFALIDTTADSEDLIRRLRSDERTAKMKLFGLGPRVNGVDAVFSRPLSVEHIIDCVNGLGTNAVAA